MAMVMCILRTKSSSLYRHREDLGLHKVGYKERNLHIRPPSLPSTPRGVPSGHGCSLRPSHLHNPSVRPVAYESTSAPWVILVINVNISLVGLMLLPSMFQISSTMEWHGLEDVEPLQDAKDKGLAQASRSRLYIFYFSDPRSH